jgi:hypothetical protein
MLVDYIINHNFDTEEKLEIEYVKEEMQITTED